MRSGTKIGLLVTILLLASTTVLAESFSVDVITIDEIVPLGETARFEFDITNHHTVPDRYTIYSREFGYILFVEGPDEDILPNQTNTYIVDISPKNFVNTGTHRAPLTVRSSTTGDTIDVNPIIFIPDPDSDPGLYTPSIALTVDTPDTIDPRDNILLKIKLRNRNPREYPKDDPITVVIQSDIFEKTYNTQLGGVGDGGEKTSEIPIDLDPYLGAGSHPLQVTILVRDQVVSESSTEFRITNYAEVEENTFKDSFLFKTTHTYKVRNDGNEEATARVVFPITIFQRPFITSNHNFEIKDLDGEQVVIVEQALEPLGEDTIEIRENYRLLILIVLLAILSVIGYYLLRSPVVLGKEASVSGTPEDGVSEIKVRLFIKNRSSKTMRNLRVIDRISGIADVVKETSLGTVKPTKVVKKKGQGTLVRWDLDQLEPFEERIITFKVKMPLKLIGDVTLPNMKVKYDLPNGRERTAHSNEVSIARKE